MKNKTMKTNETSTRLQAITWWNNLDQGQQWDMYEKHLPKKKLKSGEIVMDGLAFGGGENQIEEIFKKETSHIDPSDIEAAYKMQVKSNQKQFKQFDENLFKAYISKFSDEDKEKCFEILMRNLDVQKAELINDGINLKLVFVKF